MQANCKWFFGIEGLAIGRPRLMAMPDATFRNNSDKSSQRAMVIFMSEPRNEKSWNSRGSQSFFESNSCEIHTKTDANTLVTTASTSSKKQCACYRC